VLHHLLQVRNHYQKASDIFEDWWTMIGSAAQRVIFGNIGFPRFPPYTVPLWPEYDARLKVIRSEDEVSARDED
jgi:hypothetical protein